MDGQHILFKTYSQSHQAEMGCSRLQQEGINAYLTDQTMGSMAPYGLAVGGVKLHVAAEDVEQAQEILSEEQPTTDDNANGD